MAVGAPQQILSGKYRLERELGRGGMGSVWSAEHLTLRSPVAIKLIDPSIAANPDALARFLREAQAAASLRSPHVVQILDHGVDEGVPFIVMELLEGESLAARLERQGWLSPAETSRIITQVSRAMSRAHELGIVHRDLKPDNIFLVRNDEEEVAKVLDFGVAKASSHGMGLVSGTTRTGSVLGTPYYMSPEQAEGAKAVDHRSDLWSLGVIAWECLLGSRPFEAETLGGLLLAICARDMPVPSRVGPVLPGFDAWFSRACSRDVAHRFGSAKELAQELRVVCGTAESTGAYRGSLPSSDARGAAAQTSSQLASTTADLGLSASHQPTKRRSPLAFALLGALVVIVGGVGALFALRGGQEPIAVSATPSVASVPSATLSPPPAAAPVPVSAAPAEAPAPPPSSAPPVVAAPVHVAEHAPPRPHAVAPTPKPAKPEKAVPAPEPPAPPPQSTHPRVNLGI